MEDRVARQLAEAALFEGLADRVAADAAAGTIAWHLGGAPCRAQGGIGPFGRPRLRDGSIEIGDGRGGWRPAGFAALARLLPGTPDALRRLEAELAQTIELCDWNRRSLPPPDRRALPFARLDGAIGEGHAYHPCFKARTGFTIDDHRRYGPECGEPFRLDWLAVRRADVEAVLPTQEREFWRSLLGDDLDRIARRLAGTGASLASHALVPVHPWQLRHLRGGALVDRLARGWAVDLGPAGRRYRASQSLRTLHDADDPAGRSVKLALSVVSTSSLRTLDPRFVLTAPALSRWLGETVAGDPLFAGPYRLDLLPEDAAVLAGRAGPLAGQLAAIWRGGVRLEPGEAAVPLNALWAEEADGALLAEPWIRRHGGADRWLARLCEVVALPVWHLLVAHGIALEAHGQNAILVHRDGWPERLILRDFHESAEYAPGFLAAPERAPDLGRIDPAHAGPPDDRFHAMRSAPVLAELVTDSLFVFNLAELTHALAQRHGLDEAAFWPALGRRLARHAAEHGLEARLARLRVGEAALRVESLLRRKLGAPAEEPCFHHVPNPFRSILTREETSR
ncbi:IucA/IucC family protein [Aureimonas flava]|uniref:IucA/IucC family protein n=1 Tax=Aureimonas flava TaxID=2320271 RepID=UPI00145A0062|nr:IucA/IucC family protein [Aureimonas flava]